MRQCDGEHVQCILLVRDDFWLAFSRFMEHVEIDLLQNHNMAMIDLFDIDHAKMVLREFGRAFEKLPRNTADMSRDERAFVDQAIDGLAEDGKVIPVRIALFAEMIKSRAWSTATLKQIGGTKDAIQINESKLTTNGIVLRRDFEQVPVVVGDRHKVLQILANLVSNACYAVSSLNETRTIQLRVSASDGQVALEVEDNGIGSAQENLQKVFTFGYTTKGSQGHEFGLHSCVLAAKEMNGVLSAHSDSPNQGARFRLILPINSEGATDQAATVGTAQTQLGQLSQGDESGRLPS